METTQHNVGGWTHRWARVAPDRLAVVDGPRRLTYAAFDDRVARAAGWLAGSGVARGDRVALLLGNRSATLELVLAAARLGALSVPINTRLSPRELAFQLDDCRPALLASEQTFADTGAAACERAAHPPARRLALGDAPRDPYEQALAAAAPPAPPPVAPDPPMMLLYTSGTTGEPKGAVLPHRKTLYNALNAQLYFGIRSGEERVLVAAPLFHSLGLKILSLPILYSGGTLVLHRRFDPAAFWADVAAERITYSGGVPTQYRRLLDALDAPGASGEETAGTSPGEARSLESAAGGTEAPRAPQPSAGRDAGGETGRAAPGAEPRAREEAADGLGSLRFLFTAGAAVAADTVRAYGRHGIVLKQGFGQTETSILCCLHEADALARAGSVGRPVLHGELRLVDPACCDDPPEQWREVAAGEVGEIVVRGPITMLGYWERPEATAATLRGEWLRTGDLASRDEAGFVTLTGRARDLYISAG